MIYNNTVFDLIIIDFFSMCRELIIAIFSILITGFIAYYSIKNNAKNIFIQANQEKITNSISILSKKIERGKYDEISTFLNSSEGIYIPIQIKNQIRDYLKDQSDSVILNPELVIKMSDSLSEYLSP